MPGNNWHPPVALAARFDARTWSGAALFHRGGAGNVSAPSYGDGEGVFDDPLAFLHGYGSQAGKDLSADLNTSWGLAGGAGTITVTLTSGDFIQISSDTDDFTIPAHADNATWGFSTSGHALVGGVAPYVRTATSPWVRGNVQNKKLRVKVGGVTTAFAPSVDTTAQSVITLLRSSALSDADGGVADALETLDNDTNNNVDREIRWGINDTGHVYYTRPSTTSATITWNSTTFRDRLGFSGNEAEASSGTLRTLTADYPLPGFWVPERALDDIQPWSDETTPTLDQRSGALVANAVASRTGWIVNFLAGGYASTQDDSRHLRDRFWTYAPIGHPLTLFQHWGDPRRALASTGVTSSQTAYDLLYTSEMNGARGRLRCLRDPSDATRRAIDYRSPIRQRFHVQVVLRDRVD